MGDDNLRNLRGRTHVPEAWPLVCRPIHCWMRGRMPARPLVAGLFVSSCLLSIVSWYTTEQGMALYLSPWFSLLASLGVQSALVLVAWLIGFTRSKRALLIAVYAITAAISISFSYV